MLMGQIVSIGTCFVNEVKDGEVIKITAEGSARIARSFRYAIYHIKKYKV